jgi:hypothetical protein
MPPGVTLGLSVLSSWSASERICPRAFFAFAPMPARVLSGLHCS